MKHLILCVFLIFVLIECALGQSGNCPDCEDCFNDFEKYFACGKTSKCINKASETNSKACRLEADHVKEWSKYCCSQKKAQDVAKSIEKAKDEYSKIPGIDLDALMLMWEHLGNIYWSLENDRYIECYVAISLIKENKRAPSEKEIKEKKRYYGTDISYNAEDYFDESGGSCPEKTSCDNSLYYSGISK